MAGDWLKIEVDLPEKPEVWSIAGMLSIDADAVVGKLLKVWRWFDAHTEDGNARGVTYSLVDHLTGVTGFGEAMALNGWLLQDGSLLRLPNFERHNGKTAKNRGLTAKRVAKCKAKGNGTGNAASVTDALPREEKRREEEGEVNLPVASPAKAGQPTAGAAAMPACPADQVVALYHEVLPELPRCRVMTDARRKALQRRWRWVLSSRLADGTRRAVDAGQALDWFRRFFERARGSDFLMGRSARAAGHEGWQCDLDFLLGDKGLKAVVEKTVETA